jgi:hypothetical protein
MFGLIDDWRSLVEHQMKVLEFGARNQLVRDQVVCFVVSLRMSFVPMPC